VEYIEALGALIEVAPDSTVSRTVLKAEGARVVLFAFAAGQELSEHTAAVPILLQVIDGHLRVGADGEHVNLSPGGLVHIGASVAHEILALQPSRMILTMLDPRTATN
jgi:quercetin dioxygenase-like cupin family protein